MKNRQMQNLFCIVFGVIISVEQP